MMPLKNAIQVARGWVYQADETRRHLQGVVVEPERVWASDGHRAIILTTKAGDHALGVYLDGSDKPTPREAIKPPPIDQVILTKVDDPVVARFNVGWIRKTVRGLVNMVAKRTHLTLHFKRDRIVEAQLGENLTLAKERKNVVPAHLTMRIETGNDVTGIPYSWGLNPRYLVDAIEDLGFYDGDAIVDVRQNGGDPLTGVRIDGPRGYAIIMPVRL